MKNIIVICMTIILLCFTTFITMYIFKWKVDSHNTKEIITQIKSIIDAPIKKEDIMSFDELKNKNSDTIGYIKVNGTNIDYPFVKTKNNSYYLNHTFNKKKNDAGWVFMDYRNNIDDKNIILYAHDRKDNTMFGTLKKVLSSKWQKNEDNHIITVYLPNETRYYKVFSTYHIKTEDYYITTDFTNIDYLKFLKTLKKRSNYNYNVKLNKENKILTLSTCYTSKEKVVLHAVLLRP